MPLATSLGGHFVKVQAMCNLKQPSSLVGVAKLYEDALHNRAGVIVYLVALALFAVAVWDSSHFYP